MTKPLIIYVAENDHGDMSYGSLIEQIIQDCRSKGLNTKTFSEFSSQTAKSQKQRARTSELMSLENSRESVEETAKFLDGEFTQMGSIEARYAMWDDTWKKAKAEGVTPEQLVSLLESNVDNPELLRLMEDDLKTGAISGADKIGDLENFYAYWRSPLHYKQTHKEMAKSVRDNILEEVPDVIIMVAGTPHIKGLDQQLHELKDSRKIVVGNFPEMSNPFDVYLYSGNPKLVDGVGEVIRFDVDLSQGKVVIPALVASAISDRQEQIRTDFSRTDKPQENLTLSSVTKSHMSDVLEQIEAKRIIDALDLAKLNPAKADQKGENQKQSWVEKMTDKKLSAIKGGAREL